MQQLSRKQFLQASAAFIGASLATGLLGCRRYGETQQVSSDAPTPIRIGAIGPITGEHAVYGASAHFGARVAVDEINAKGKRTFVLNWQDGTGDPSSALASYEVLKDWGAHVILGPTLTQSFMAVVPKTETDNTFELAYSASSLCVLGSQGPGRPLEPSDHYLNVYQSCVSDQELAKQCAEALAAQYGKSKIGIIYNAGLAYSEGLTAWFEHYAKDYHLVISKSVSLLKNDSDAVERAVKQLKQANIEVVFMPLYCAQIAAVLKEARALAFAPVFMGVDGIDALLSMPNFDLSLANHMLGMSTFFAGRSDKKAQLFVSKYEQLVDGVKPCQYSADAYDAIYIINDLFEKSGLDWTATPSEVNRRFAEVLRSQEFRFSGLTGSDIAWRPDGTCTKTAKLVEIDNGHIKER